MNKKLILSMACFGLVLTLSACGTTQTPTVAGNNNPAPGTNRRPDYGQPKTQPEIRGLVKSVIGNEVIILKIDRPQGATSTATSTASGTKTPILSLTGGTGDTGGRPAGGFAGGGNRPGGQGGLGGPGGGTNTATDRTAMLERMKAMSTGEEKVIIPVGIQMLKSDSSNTGKQRSMVEATISDITADKSLTIWLDASVSDKKVASFVMIN